MAGKENTSTNKCPTENNQGDLRGDLGGSGESGFEQIWAARPNGGKSEQGPGGQTWWASEGMADN